ncbi:MAG: tetratricopeptide repeat protein [Bacillota bacterium]
MKDLRTWVILGLFLLCLGAGVVLVSVWIPERNLSKHLEAFDRALAAHDLVSARKVLGEATAVRSDSPRLAVASDRLEDAASQLASQVDALRADLKQLRFSQAEQGLNRLLEQGWKDDTLEEFTREIQHAKEQEAEFQSTLQDSFRVAQGDFTDMALLQQVTLRFERLRGYKNASVAADHFFLLAAQAMSMRREFETALSYLDRMESDGPATAPISRSQQYALVYVLQGLAAYESGDYDSAETSLAKAASHQKVITWESRQIAVQDLLTQVQAARRAVTPEQDLELYFPAKKGWWAVYDLMGRGSRSVQVVERHERTVIHFSVISDRSGKDIGDTMVGYEIGAGAVAVRAIQGTIDAKPRSASGLALRLPLERGTTWTNEHGEECIISQVHATFTVRAREYRKVLEISCEKTWDAPNGKVRSKVQSYLAPVVGLIRVVHTVGSGRPEVFMELVDSSGLR